MTLSFSDHLLRVITRKYCLLFIVLGTAVNDMGQNNAGRLQDKPGGSYAANSKAPAGMYVPKLSLIANIQDDATYIRPAAGQ